MRTYVFLTLAILTAFSLSGQLDAQNAKSPSEEFYKPLKWRNIGPFRGGRSVCASGVKGDPLTYYMGTTGGGLWKTDDAGQIWNNISDGFFKTGSVGAVAVSESDPNVVYCGMGEHAPRGVMTSHGDGVYKSTDAGKTWKHIGLKETQHIARIVIHPKNPDIVYVAAQGALHGSTEERGIYRSMDGGQTWEKVLYVDEKTGCSELSMDMNNPNVLYATMWEHGRLPWKVISGGPGSGVYKTTDAGKTWKKIQKGLPKELGKMAISVCRSNSNKVYALIESDSDKELGGLFVSQNAGESWTRISNDHRLIQRAWYYIEVFADPVDEHTVYVLSAPALRSIDGGKTWERITGTHGDFHDLWINPDNPTNLCIANDGGAAISFNRGKTWSRQDNMPTAQFYRVNVDNAHPYRIYGGQQDNTSVVIANRELHSSGISERSWTYSAGGESAFLAFDPDDPKHVLGGSYLGTIEVLYPEVAAETNIMAAPIQYLGRDAKDMKYRYNWNAPIIWSQHEPNTYYHAAQVLLRTRDLGLSWEEVSPDLTRNEIEKQGKGGGPYTNEAVGAENYGTISYVKESSHRAGEIWVGTDDGLVQVTRNGGENWDNVTPSSLEECLVNAIEISPHDPNTIYIATTRYKFNDHKPGIYKSTNGGKSWEAINNGIPKNAFTRVLREDPDRKDLLFAGTEIGMFVSWDGGQNWESFQLNLPITPILDMIMHRGDLIVATSGRSFWILDDVGLLSQAPNFEKELAIYRPESTMLQTGYSQLNGNSKSFKGTHPFQGVNPATGSVIYYKLPKLEKSDHIRLQIHDKDGILIREFSSQKDSTYLRYDGGPPAKPVLSKSEGLNRFVWDLRRKTAIGVPKAYIEGSYRGHQMPPGTYQVTLSSGNKEVKTSLEIMANPTYPITDADYNEYHQFMTRMEDDLNDMHSKINMIKDLSDQLRSTINHLPESKNKTAFVKEAKEVLAKMKSWDEDMVQRKSKAYDDVENFPNKFTANYLFLINQTESSIPRVTQPSKDRFKELDKEWMTLKATAEDIIDVQVPKLNERLWNMGIGALQHRK